MASSQNLPSFEPFLFRETFPDSWISEAYARDTETLTKALQSTFNSLDNTLLIPSDSPAPTPSASTVSAASDADPAPNRRRSVPGSAGRVAKRKSRASKRSQTTFITADPANFRQMVQQITGVRFCSGQLPVSKPEPQRLGGRGGGCLPTLDTSAFVLDQQVVFGSGSGGFAQPVLAEGGADLDCITVSSFPTLESWS